jgi:glycosyltransferase involved in cell wall biosynthesis
MKRFVSWEIKEFVLKPHFDERVILNKDPSWPKISIVTPSYNQGEFLERTILSVLNQNYPNLEYIIIDGNSTDKSVEIIKKYERFLTHWISKKDLGQSEAINEGFKIATGEIVAWQNSDDLYLPGAFFRVMEEFKKDSDSEVIFGNIYLINENDDILKELRFIPFNVEHLIYYDWNLSSQGAFWKRKLFDTVGYLKNYKVSFDLDWFIRLGKATRKFRLIRVFLGGYRIHSKSKFSLIKDNVRNPVFIEIIKKNDLKINEGKNWTQQYRLKKLKTFLRRIFWYIIQGDIDYVFMGILYRIRYGKQYLKK